MKKKTCVGMKIGIVLLVSLTTGLQSLSAITFKVASTAPEATPYGEILNRIASRWNRASDGQVKLRLFHNGIAGGEADVIRKMRIGQIHVGIFTTNGLAFVSQKIFTISAPGLIRSVDELNYVFEHIEADLSNALREERMEPLGWARPGWVYLFSNSAVRTPDDLKRLRIATNPDNEGLTLSLRKQGFRATPVSITEWLTGMNSGLIDALIGDALVVAGLQIFTKAPYMLDLQIAPYLAGFVISERSWRRVPEDLQPELRQIVIKEINNLEIAAQQSVSDAIEVMQSYGLNRTSISDRQRKIWLDTFSAANDVSIGTAYDAELYGKIEELLVEYRQ